MAGVAVWLVGPGLAGAESLGQPPEPIEKRAMRAREAERTVRIAPDSEAALTAAREAAQIALNDTKDFTQATFFLRHVVRYTKSDTERVSAQQSLAETYFEKLNNYSAAVTELNRALDLMKRDKSQAPYRLMLARAHFFLNQFFQAKSEIDEALKENVDQEFVFKAKLLKANILFNEKKLDDAIIAYQKLSAEYPDKALSEQVSLSLAVCYEEKEDFIKAIELLEKLRAVYHSPEMIDLKIRRLRERQAQAPGAKGLKK